MQPAPEKADITKRHAALLSTHKKHKAASEAHVRAEASTVPDFLQLGSDIEDNSSNVFPLISPALLEDNMTTMYHREVANTSVLPAEREYSGDKEQPANDSSIWPWVRLGSIVRKRNDTKDTDVLN